jgi:hypothetical protein
MHKGFGFNVVLNYRGARRIDHGGGWLGYNCDLRLLPDHGGGVMVLTNRSDSGTAVLTNTILDHLLGLEPLPWLERLRPPRATRREQAAKDRAARAEARHRDTRPSHALPDYAHNYAHPAYGEVRIICDGDALRWQGMGLDLPMAHRHYDVFETASDDVEWFGVRTVQFATGVEGDIESLCVPLEPAVAPIVFRRQPEAEMTTRAFLEPARRRLPLSRHRVPHRDRRDRPADLHAQPGADRTSFTPARDDFRLFRYRIHPRRVSPQRGRRH